MGRNAAKLRYQISLFFVYKKPAVPLEGNATKREILIKSLVSLGLPEVDAEIYLLLSRDGPQTGRSIAEVLSLYKQQLYRSLKNLQCKGCVKATCDRPSRFSAVAIEEVIDLLVDLRLDEAQDMEENRQEILSYWRTMIRKDTTQQSL